MTPRVAVRIALPAAAAFFLLTGCGAPGAGADTVEMHIEADPSVSMAVWFDAGSADDPPGKEGLAYVTGQLLSDGGTTELSYQEILDELYPMAAGYSVRVDKEMTTLSGRVHEDNLDAYLDLFIAAFVEPAFDDADFERIRTDAINSIEKTLRYASDEELGKSALERLVFEGTAYSHPVTGTVAGLRSLTVDDVKGFYRDRLGANGAGLAIGGGYPDEARRKLESAIAKLPAGGAAPEAKSIAPKAVEGRRVLLVDKPGADASISFGHPISVRRGDRDYYALFIANSWLGEHRNSSSHLFQVIREQRGMNYGDYSYIEAFPQGGSRQFPPPNVARSHQLFQVWIRTLPGEWAHFALRAAVREVEDLVENGMSEEDFELTREFLRKYALHFADTTSMRLGYAMDDRFYGIDDHLGTFRKMMDEITLEDVNDALKRHIDPDRLSFAIVTGEARALSAALASDAPSPVAYPTPKADSILEEDELIASYPLSIATERIESVPIDGVFEE